ncbi:hypothetical protein ABZX99_06765 [Streptomyces antibioticus]|uniref:hypothetical protein n=1 Tax=Streptomyces antibioticus TaxID=1890 RepID=UPI0033A316E0
MTPDTTPAPLPVEPPADVLVHSGTARERTAAQWLVLSAPDPHRARAEWETTGIALLRCDALFTAVRMPADLVHAACGTDDEQRVDGLLAEALHGGPVFVDRTSRHYYALVPRGTADREEWRSRPRAERAECLGPDSYLGVPALTEPGPGTWRSRWCVPVDSPGTLCSPEAVHRLVTRGHSRIAAGEAEDGA